MTTTVYLIRHAQSHPTAGIEHADWPLSERGRAQADELAGLLMSLGLERIVSSPFTRCLQTIGPFASRADLRIEVRDGLRERYLGIDLDGDFPAIWRRSWEDLDFALPGCETSRDAQRRFVDTIDRILAESEGKTVGICAHGNVIGLFLHFLDERNGRETAERLTNPDVLRFTVDDGDIAWDGEYALPGLKEVATDSADTPIRREPAGE